MPRSALDTIKRIARKLVQHITSVKSAVPRRQMQWRVERPLVVVAGCTGTGKSDLGVSIAEAYGGEVISADSIQIYQGLDIASNKLSAEEMRGIPHHMMSFLHHSYDYHVHQYREAALKLLHEIWARGRLPVLVGGTQYYVESVIFTDYLINCRNTDDPERIRERYYKGELGKEDLLRVLKEVDPQSARQIPEGNAIRLMRALEVYYGTGKTRSEIVQQRLEEDRQGVMKLRFPNTLLINLNAPKDVLNERIDRRVGKMMERGLLREIEQFYQENKEKLHTYGFGIMQSIGIKEFVPYLELSEDDRGSDEGQRRLAKAIGDLKFRTKQLRRYQQQWQRNRLLRRAVCGQLPNYLTLNTDSDFYGELVPFVVDQLVAKFLSGETIPSQESTAWDDNPLVMRLPLREEIKDPNYVRDSNTLYYCETCGTNIQSKCCYEVHLRGKRHMRALLRARKRAERCAKAASEEKPRE